MNPYGMPMIAPYLAQMYGQAPQNPYLQNLQIPQVNLSGQRMRMRAPEMEQPQQQLPQIPMPGSYDPNERVKNALGMEMKRGTMDALSDFGAGIGQAFDNPFVQALSYADRSRRARMGGDPEAQQRAFENQMAVEELNLKKDAAGKTKWQQGTIYDESTGQEQKILYNENDPTDWRPLGGAKKKDVNFQTTTIYDKSGRAVTGVFNPDTGKLEGQLGYAKAESKQPGFHIRTNPDGSTEVIYGDDAGNSALTKPTVNDVQKDILAAQDQLANLSAIEKSFKPEYLQYAEQGKNWAADKASKLGIDINPERTAKMRDYAQFKQQVQTGLNTTIKAQTGATITQGETPRIEAVVPNMDDGPEVFQSKLKQSTRMLRAAQARKIYSLQKGVGWDTIGLDDVEGLIDKRGAEIEQELRSRGVKDENQIKQTTRAQLQREFGI